MSNEVRVHIRLGSTRLAYEGPLAFYETHVEPFVAEASRRGDGLVHRVRAAGRDARAEGGAVNGAAPKPPPFVPKSSEFGRFVRRLGPEASDPSRQVLALAFYLWNYERRETFTPAEVAGCFAALSLPAPDDIEALLGVLTDERRFLEAAGEGVWRLTKKGESYVKTRLLSA